MTSAVANSAASTLYGAGNSRILAEQIKAYINAPGRTAAEIQSAAEANGVSAEQISRAMAGNKAFSAQSISSYLASQGSKPTPASKTAPAPSPAAAAAILYGAGNADISDAEIQDYVNQPGRTPEQVLAGALANGLSAAQIARAMAGHPDYTLAHINQSLAAQGISSADASADPLDFRAEILFGAGNPQVSSAQIQDFVNQPGATSEHILAAAIEHGVSAEQLAAALPDRPEFSVDNITNYIESRGIATQRDPSRTVNLQGSVLYGAGNAAISDTEIQAYIHTPGRSEDQILHAALANGVSLAQIAKAMDGHPAFTLENLNDAVGFKQDLSAVEVLLLQQAQLLQELDAASSPQAADAASQKAMDVLRASLAQFEPQLEAARAKVDARIAAGQAQDAVAAQAENAAAELKAQFDPLQLQRLQAQAKIDEQQGAVDTAQSEINAAQAALGAANQAIADAAAIKKKSRRHRTRGEAEYAAKAAGEALSAAQQKLTALQPGLSEAQAAAAPAFAAAQAMQLQWEAAQQAADSAHVQAGVRFGSAQRAVQLEVAVKQALAQSQLQLSERGQAKAGQLQAQIDASALKGAARAEALKSIALDALEAAELVQRIDAQAAQDRLRESALTQAAVPLQTQAAGAALIAQNLLGDAVQLDAANGQVQTQLSQAQGELDAANARLLSAQIALTKADFAVDWDQAKKDVKKSSKAIAVDQPKLDAAQAEFDAAQDTVDQTTAQFSRLQHLASPLGTAMLEAAFAAGSAVQNAVTTASQANAAVGWVQLAQTRFESSDQWLAISQAGLIQNTRAAANAEGNSSSAADAYAAQINDARQAAQTTRAEQNKQNEFAIQAGAAQILSSFLKGKFAHANEVAVQAQAQITVQQDDFQKAQEHAGALAPAAEPALQAFAAADLDAAFAFALTRAKLSPEQLQEAQADKAAFVQTWQERELADRKTQRKQIHLFDDLAQFQLKDPAAQAARQHALDTAQALEQASQSAIDAGDTLQASLIVAGLLGQAALDAQSQLVQATADVAELSTQTGSHALVLGQAAQAEVAALGSPDSAAAQLAGEIAAQMPQNAAAWSQAGAAWKAQSAQESATLEQARATLAQNTQSRNAIGTQTASQLAEQMQLHSFAQGALKSYAERDEHIQELHQDRKLMDEAHKRAKKGGLLKILIMVGITIVAAVATVMSWGALSGPMATAEMTILGALGLTGTAGAEAGAAGAGAAGSLAVGSSEAAMGALGASELTLSVSEAVAAGATEAGAVGATDAAAMSAGDLAAMRAPVNLGRTVLQGVGPRTAVFKGLQWGVAGAVGNLVQQGLSVATGQQDKFEWSHLALSTLSAGVTGGLFAAVGGTIQTALMSGMESVGLVGAAVRGMAPTMGQQIAGHVAAGLTGAAINTAVQGGMVAIDLQDKFDWSQTAAMGLTAALSSATYQRFLEATRGMTGFSEVAAKAAYNTGVNFSGGMLGHMDGKLDPLAIGQQSIDFGAGGSGSHAPVGNVAAHPGLNSHPFTARTAGLLEAHPFSPAKPASFGSDLADVARTVPTIVAQASAALQNGINRVISPAGQAVQRQGGALTLARPEHNSSAAPASGSIDTPSVFGNRFGEIARTGRLPIDRMAITGVTAQGVRLTDLRDRPGATVPESYWSTYAAHEDGTTASDSSPTGNHGASPRHAEPIQVATAKIPLADLFQTRPTPPWPQPKPRSQMDASTLFRRDVNKLLTEVQIPRDDIPTVHAHVGILEKLQSMHPDEAVQNILENYRSGASIVDYNNSFQQDKYTNEGTTSVKTRATTPNSRAIYNPRQSLVESIDISFQPDVSVREKADFLAALYTLSGVPIGQPLLKFIIKSQHKIIYAKGTKEFNARYAHPTGRPRRETLNRADVGVIYGPLFDLTKSKPIEQTVVGMDGRPIENRSYEMTVGHEAFHLVLGDEHLKQVTEIQGQIFFPPWLSEAEAHHRKKVEDIRNEEYVLIYDNLLRIQLGFPMRYPRYKSYQVMKNTLISDGFKALSQNPENRANVLVRNPSGTIRSLYYDEIALQIPGGGRQAVTFDDYSQMVLNNVPVSELGLPIVDFNSSYVSDNPLDPPYIPTSPSRSTGPNDPASDAASSTVTSLQAYVGKEELLGAAPNDLSPLNRPDRNPR